MLMQVNGFVDYPGHREQLVGSLRFLATQYSAEHFATKGKSN
jgi:hypothetical protein